MNEGYVPPPITEKEFLQARVGAGEFADILRATDDDARRFFTRMRSGRQIQAMYLGLKPACSLTDESENKDILMARQAGYIQRYSGNKFGVIDTIVYEPQATLRVIRTHPEVFPPLPDLDALPGYLRGIYTAPGSDRRHVQLGSLFGFPDAAIVSYLRFHKNASTVNRILRSKRGLTQPQRSSILAYENPADTPPDEDRLNYVGLLQTYFPQLSSYEHESYATPSVVNLPGFLFSVYGKSAQVDDFKYRVQTLFEVSGMNELVRRNQ